VAVAVVALQLVAAVQAVRVAAVLAQYQTITEQQEQPIVVAVAVVALVTQMGALILVVLAVKVLSLFAQPKLVNTQRQLVLHSHNQAVFIFILLTTLALLSGVRDGLLCKTRRQHSRSSH
jgi:hypothetical protein